MSLWRAADGLCKQDPPQPRAVSCWTEERTGASPQCCGPGSQAACRSVGRCLNCIRG